MWIAWDDKRPIPSIRVLGPPPNNQSVAPMLASAIGTAQNRGACTSTKEEAAATSVMIGATMRATRAASAAPVNPLASAMRSE
jgi:hypothetical protein